MEIEKITQHLQAMGIPVHFGHIATQHYAADCATRGLTQTELADHIWWTGPAILHDPPKSWSSTLWTFDYDTGFENEHQDATTNKKESEVIEPLEELKENAKRIIARVLRYIAILVARVNARRDRPIRLSALLEESLQHQVRVHIKFDPDDLLRCSGCLGKSDLDGESKTPLLVLQNSWSAEVLIRDRHNNGHPGISHTMSLVRQSFWIPKLRAEMTRIIRHCIPCQKFNNFPYKYPEQGDLPAERVCRSRPFAHVGLDYFGPLSILKCDGTERKCYGRIITCMATRLVHLDVVSDLSTTALLMMLRRFFARRGQAVSITSDNAPTFTLGETTLSECLHAVQNDPAVERTITSREIQRKHIMPYAPWQKGFYERPIDFLQNEFEVPYPLDDIAEDERDPSYLPPGEQVLLRTKTQTIKALQTSCKFTEKFWRDQYLLASHQREVGKNRSLRYSPRKDDIVLINEPILPRHSWKMGRIHDLIMSSEGVIRKAVIMLPFHRQIRRPINLLVPLELEDEKRKNEDSPVQVQEPKSASSSTSTERIHESENCPESIPSSNKQTSRYNLRPRRQVDYRGILSIIRANQSATLLTILLILAIGDLYSDEAYQHSSSTRPIRCIDGGVGLISPPHIPYQVCAAEFCRTYGDPQMNVTLRFPSQVILHDHQVQWKFTENETTTII
ncbi:hypothetical protein RB195_025125 [Necator americanus]|uniref:Integrase catalytic domain-containing protein n=1 Tax=Necator americanus TaxID=51031 RepID=A0ABR1ER03_NECAM